MQQWSRKFNDYDPLASPGASRSGSPGGPGGAASSAAAQPQQADAAAASSSGNGAAQPPQANGRSHPAVANGTSNGGSVGGGLAGASGARIKTPVSLAQPQQHAAAASSSGDAVEAAQRRQQGDEPLEGPAPLRGVYEVRARGRRGRQEFLRPLHPESRAHASSNNSFNSSSIPNPL
jgi:hypothetical protein